LKQINVLQLISGLGQGGAEKLILDLSSEYKNSNMINNYVVSISEDDTMLSKFQKNSIKTTVLYQTKTLRGLIVTIKKLLFFVKNKKISIIHAHMFHSMIIAVILKFRFPKLKIIFTPHNYNIGNKNREYIVGLLKIFREIDILFSHDMKKWFYKKRYHIIVNGINIEDFNIKNKKYEIFTFIAIGNIKTAKNYSFLIECVNRLHKKIQFRLFIVGDGSDRVKLELKVKKLKLEQTIFFKGLQDNIPELLSKSHCLVMPSLWEGMPLSILEAGVSKIPVIATPVGAIPCIIDNNNGYIVNLDEFCQTMENVYSQYSEALNKAEKLYQKIINKYSIKQIAKEYESIYIKVNT